VKIKAVGHKETPMPVIAPAAAPFYITGGTLPPNARSYVERACSLAALVARDRDLTGKERHR
jgi:hypothetical protein